MTVEEGVVSGGVGEEVLRILAQSGKSVPALTLGIPDQFVVHGKKPLLLREIGLDAQGVADAILHKLGC